ncbi:MAG: hypothetical protein GY801_33075 [bacterium]|nr:hypothetical protein [bacterium]
MIHRRIRRIVINTSLLFFLLLGVISGCSKEQGKNPTGPTGEHVIIVDSQQAASKKFECGASNASCPTLAAALHAAESIKGGIPTIWIKAGSYQLGSAAPLEIRTPIILQAEEKQKVEIHSEATAFQIFASNVTIEGLNIISHNADQVASVMVNGGQALFKDSNIFHQGDPIDPGGIGLSIDNGGHAILENSRVESFGITGVDVLSGKVSSQASKLEGGGEAVRIHKNGRGTFERSVFQGNIFSSGGSLTISQCETGSISITNGAYATLSENTIRGSVDLMWKHAYAEIRDNMIYGRVSATDAKATIETTKIYGNQQGEGVTAFNFAMLTLTNNSITGMKNALYAHPSSTLILNHNLFNSETEGTSTIFCEAPVEIASDGTNTLRNAELNISCEGLPSNPGTENF